MMGFPFFNAFLYLFMNFNYFYGQFKKMILIESCKSNY